MHKVNHPTCLHNLTTEPAFPCSRGCSSDDMATSFSTRWRSVTRHRFAYAIARGLCADDACVRMYEDSVRRVYKSGGRSADGSEDDDGVVVSEMKGSRRTALKVIFR